MRRPMIIIGLTVNLAHYKDIDRPLELAMHIMYMYMYINLD